MNFFLNFFDKNSCSGSGSELDPDSQIQQSLDPDQENAWSDTDSVNLDQKTLPLIVKTTLKLKWFTWFIPCYVLLYYCNVYLDEKFRLTFGVVPATPYTKSLHPSITTSDILPIYKQRQLFDVVSQTTGCIYGTLHLKVMPFLA
jgi:hypothetical protein